MQSRQNKFKCHNYMMEKGIKLKNKAMKFAFCMGSSLSCVLCLKSQRKWTCQDHSVWYTTNNKNKEGVRRVRCTVSYQLIVLLTTNAALRLVAHCDVTLSLTMWRHLSKVNFQGQCFFQLFRKLVSFAFSISFKLTTFFLFQFSFDFIKYWSNFIDL